MTRPTARSRRRDRLFFTALENGHRIGHACADAGYARASVYEWRKSDGDFQDRWRSAKQMGSDLLEEEAERRARLGTDVPVFHAGEQVGTKRKYSDALLLARLKAEMPEKYGNRPFAAPSHEPKERLVILRDFAVEDIVVRMIADGRASADELPPNVIERINGGRKDAGLPIIETSPKPIAPPPPDEDGA